MIEELRKLIRDDVALFLMAMGALAVGIFGAVNWNSYCRPQVPHKSVFESPEIYEARVARYHEDATNLGKDALVPFAVAVPMTVCGLFAGVVALCVVANRNS